MRALGVCSIAVSLAAALPSLAQGISDRGPLTQGAEAPGQSFALQDDGTSLGGNPAGLGFIAGWRWTSSTMASTGIAPATRTRSISPPEPVFSPSGSGSTG